MCVLRCSWSRWHIHIKSSCSPKQITVKLYIIKVMLDLNIKAIVTVLRNGFVEHDKSEITDHLHIPADDY